MHTQNLTPATRHRWIIAAPLFALCVLASAWPGRPAPQASVVAEAGYVFDGNGLTESGSGLLLNGSVMIGSRMQVSLRAGPFDVSVWNGVMQTSYDGQTLSVATLTAPALIRRGSGVWLIPDGMQMTATPETASDILPLPAHYLDDALPRADALFTDLPPVTYNVQDLLAAADADLQQLLALHASTRDQTWVLSDVVSLQALSLLPASDHGNEAVSPLAVTHWGQAWAAYLQAAENPAAVIESALPGLAADIGRLQNAGYPERALNYAQALAGAVEWYRGVLHAGARAQLDTVADIAAGHAPAPLPAKSESSVTETIPAPSPVSSERAAEMTEAVRAMLQANGVMFTARSSVTAVDAAHVRVREIVIGTAEGDRIIGFTYDPDTNEVSDIVKDGRTFPNAMPLGQYLEWVRK